MANQKLTIYQKLQKVLATGSTQSMSAHSNTYNIRQQQNTNDVVDIARSPQERDMKILQAKQQKLMARQWYRAQANINNQSLAGLNDVRLMYRDVDLMDCMPEIGTALDLISEEACYVGESGTLVNVSSGSERVKGILQDLFVNRLSINTTLPMLTRSMLKYGNAFWLLHTDTQLGVLGWKELPVYEIERYENGMDCPYTNGYSVNATNIDEHKDETRFIWVGQQQATEYRNWQIAHFRLLYDSSMLPYGVSFLHKARRHFRMLSMMEDMMLIYRLDRSVERRVFKINVGAIDEADVPAYVQQIADSFKRTEIIDPMTGQVDLRKNIMPVWKKTPIPLLDGRTITIEDLANEYENGKVNYVYSVQDETKQIVPGKVVWCGKNYTAKKMVKITLDDDTFMVMAPEHEVVMRDGSKKRADKLCEGESVMPFYRLDETLGSNTKGEYEQVYNPNSGLYEFTHRLVAKELLKEDNENTIHHINFNRHDNTPSNLQWMTWDAHKDLHTSLNSDPLVRKSRSELKRKLWGEGNNREIYSRNMRVEFDKVVWDEIEYAIRNGEIYSQKSMVDFINENLIEYLSSINPSRKLRHNHFISKMTVRERIHDLGFKDCDEYIESIEHKYGLKSHYDVLNEQKSERAIANETYKSLGDKRVEANYTIDFDDFIWDILREKVLDGTLNHGTDIIDYINTNLLAYVNVINNTYILKMNQGTLLRLLRKKGFKGSKDYIDKIKKNHKVKSVEYIDGDDVYCMTVVGLNGEEDRHNFALRTFNEDESWSDSGCFVSNCQTNDFFIPVREDGAASPIETLPAGQNLTAMDDIKYIQNKIVTALRVPKTFLNFEEASGDGKNLSLLDVRFMRTVNRIQQALLLELNKIATIHLLMLGFTDDLTNFTLEMANPSSQAEMLELENLAKKVTTAKDAVSDPGGGMPLTSMTWVWKHIFKWSDKEIQQNLEELRLETALAAELQQTTQIIKKTHIYDPVDNIYGEPGAEYSAAPQQGQDDGGMGGPGGGGGLPMGGDMDFGDEMGGEDAMGAEGDMDMGAAADEDAAMNIGGGGEQPMEGGTPNLAEMVTSSLKQNVLNELSKRKETLVKKDKAVKDKLFERYLNTISDRSKKDESKQQPIYDKAFFMNEEMNDLINKMTITQKKTDLLNG